MLEENLSLLLPQLMKVAFFHSIFNIFSKSGKKAGEEKSRGKLTFK
jgi:hypothetical protein